MNELSSKTSLKPYLPLLLVLGSVTAFGPLSIDLYLPAFPTISSSLNATMPQVELTLAVYFFGLAGGQLIYGPLADKFGRKKPLIAGLIIFVIASLLCALSTSIEQLILFRFLQSLGSCAGMVISRAIVRDMFKPQDSARVFSTLMLITSAAPILAPLIGGLIILHLTWNWTFFVLSILSAFALIGVMMFLPETIKEKNNIGFKTIFSNYTSIFKDKTFSGYALAGSCAQAGLFAYITGSPFVFIEYFGIPANYYGLIFGSNAIFLVIMSQINARLVTKYEMRKIFKVVFSVILLSGFSLVVCGLIANHFLTVAIPLCIYIASMGIIFPNTTAAALSNQGKKAGSASALIGCIQFGFAALSSTLVSSLKATTPVTMTGVMGFFAVTSFLFYYFIVIKKVQRVQKADLEQSPLA